MWEGVLVSPRRLGGKSGTHLPLETEEVQKGAGRGFSAPGNPLGSPSPRPPAGPAEVSEEGGAQEAEGAASGGRAGAELPSISGEAAFYGRY